VAYEKRKLFQTRLYQDIISHALTVTTLDMSNLTARPRRSSTHSTIGANIGGHDTRYV
jgi:hypothetical protein